MTASHFCTIEGVARQPGDTFSIVSDDVAAAFLAAGMVTTSGGSVTPNIPVVATTVYNTVTTSGAAQTIPAQGNAGQHRITLTANCTLTFPTAGTNKSFLLTLVQDGTGSRTVVWPASVKWAGGTAPTLSTAAGKVDVFEFECSDGSTWVGRPYAVDAR